jgi:hypothetical protein
MVATRWKVTVVDGGNGGTYSAEFTTAPGEDLWKKLAHEAEMITPNCVHTLTLEYKGEE